METGVPARRLEDRIRTLLAELLQVKDDSERMQIIEELRCALNLYIERLHDRCVGQLLSDPQDPLPKNRRSYERIANP